MIKEINRYYEEILKDGIRWCLSETQLKKGGKCIDKVFIYHTEKR